MKRLMLALAVAVLMASPAAAMDCGDSGEAGTQAWLDSCLLALADDSAFGPMKPFGLDWIVADNQLCQLFFPGLPADSTVSWTGECVDGKAHGEGRIDARGSWGYGTSVGTVREGRRHGRGVTTYADGSRYEGDFVDGKEHGRGAMTWANGNRYEGDFVDGERAGRGVFTWADGGRYEGDFVDGERTGHGAITWANGNRYEGDFVDGKQHGQGVFSWANGDRHEGNFVDGDRHGQGAFTGANGDYYEGGYARNRPHGYGTYISTSGKRYDGQWRNGCFGERGGTWVTIGASREECGF